MSSQHIQTRHKIKALYSVNSFEDLLNSCILTEEDKQIMRLHYLDGKDLAYIADFMGFSESTVKRRHRAILNRLGKLI